MCHLPGPNQDSLAPALQALVPLPTMHRNLTAAGHLPAQLPALPADDTADSGRVPVSSECRLIYIPPGLPVVPASTGESWDPSFTVVLLSVPGTKQQLSTSYATWSFPKNRQWHQNRENVRSFVSLILWCNSLVAAAGKHSSRSQ